MVKSKIHLGFKIYKYIIWPALSCLLLYVLALYAFTFDQKLGIVGLISATFNLIIFITMYVLARRRLLKETLNLAAQVSDIQKDHMIHFDLPHGILDLTGRIMWYNDALYDMIGEPKLKDKSIFEFISEVSLDEFPTYEEPYETMINYNDKTFRYIIHQHQLDSAKMALVKDESAVSYFSIYLYDITEEMELKRINREQKGVFGYIYIDNFDEVVQSIEDVRRPLLIALIDRNLNTMIKKLEGVLKKIEKDKYIIFFQRRYLEVLKEEKFSILDDIRSINIGNELPVTISMGIGVSTTNYVEVQDFARMAIDLALGRGGDQAVIKNRDKFLFYGGKTRGVETSGRVKARMKAYAFREILNESDNVIIMGHRFQDLDSLGAAIGIYACCRVLQKEANIVLDNVTTSVKALYDRVQDSEHFPEDLIVTGNRAMELVNDNTVLVIVDVNRPSYLEYQELYDITKKVVVFDHHRVSAEQVDRSVLSYVEPYASSTCEMVSEILRYITEKVKLDPLEADALFAGISVDTKNFVVKTGVKTFEAAAFLRRNGADVIRVRKFFKNDMESYKAKASAVRDATIYREKMAISVSPSNVNNATLVAAQAADELLNIAGIKASFVLTDIDGTKYISARSYDAINVQVIMERLGGGGHLSVAGAQIKDVNMDEAIALLKESIDVTLEEGEEE